MTQNIPTKIKALIPVVLIVISVIGFAGFFYYVFGIKGFGAGMQDYELNINDYCTMHRNSVDVIFIRCRDIQKKIDEKVSKVAWNDKYLIATTNPLTKKRHSFNPDNIIMIPDNTIQFWWIVDLEKKENFGPLSIDEFNALKAKLNIPDLNMYTVPELKRANRI
jgi:hypothetical protein